MSGEHGRRRLDVFRVLIQTTVDYFVSKAAIVSVRLVSHDSPNLEDSVLGFLRHPIENTGLVKKFRGPSPRMTLHYPSNPIWVSRYRSAFLVSPNNRAALLLFPSAR